MKFETSSLRRTSESDDVLPWRAGDVTFICVTATGTVTQAKRIEEKRAILDAVGPDDCLLVAWPGQWRQDIFVIDDREGAQRGLDTPNR